MRVDELDIACDPWCASNRDADLECDCHIDQITKLKAENELLLSYKKEVADMSELMFQFTMQRVEASRRSQEDK